MLKEQNVLAKWIRFCILNFIGVVIYAVAMNCFAAPHQIAPGGASGIAVLVNYLTGMPVGAFVFCFNIPFLIWCLVKKSFSKAFVMKTVLTTGLLSIVTDVFVAKMPVYQGNTLLAAMFCGALMGIGMALVHLGGSNTGGISLLGLLIQQVYPGVEVGTLISVLNIGVVLASGIVYGNIESSLYAMVAVYISGGFMDRILNGAAAKDLMLVISERTDEVRGVCLELQKGITVLKGEGGYTSERQRVILCAVNKNECQELQKKIKEVDQQAMIIVTRSSLASGSL